MKHVLLLACFAGTEALCRAVWLHSRICQRESQRSCCPCIWTSPGRWPWCLKQVYRHWATFSGYLTDEYHGSLWLHNMGWVGGWTCAYGGSCVTAFCFQLARMVDVMENIGWVKVPWICTRMQPRGGWWNQGIVATIVFRSLRLLDVIRGSP